MNEEKLNEMFEIFKPMSKAKHCNRNHLVRAFGSIFGAYADNAWRVVGITEDALEAFALIDFKRIPNKKDPIAVERAHIHKRALWVEELFKTEWNSANEWWDFIYKNDRTVLATTKENYESDNMGIPLKIAYEIPDNGQYFVSQYIGCKYRTKVERVLLEDFYHNSVAQ